jgi:hypothetical protein
MATKKKKSKKENVKNPPNKKRTLIRIAERVLAAAGILFTVFFGFYAIITDHSNSYAEELIIKAKSMDYQLAMVNENIKQGIALNKQKEIKTKKPNKSKPKLDTHSAYAIDSSYITRMDAIITEGDSLVKKMKEISSQFNSKQYDSTLMADVYTPVIIQDTLVSETIKVKVENPEKKSFMNRVWFIIKQFFKNLFTRHKSKSPILKPENEEEFTRLKNVYASADNTIVIGDLAKETKANTDTDKVNTPFEEKKDSLIDTNISIGYSKNLTDSIITNKEKETENPSTLTEDYLKKMIINSRWEGNVQVFKPGINVGKKKKYLIYFQFNQDGTCETNYFNTNKIASEIQDKEEREKFKKACTFNYSIADLKIVNACVILKSAGETDIHSIFKCTAHFDKSIQNYKNTDPTQMKEIKIVLTKLKKQDIQEPGLFSEYNRKEIK